MGSTPSTARTMTRCMFNNATLTGVGPEPVVSTTTEILRRQPDGGWVHVVDDPFFS
nr:hypothetical protein OG999_28220 [Streptomyces sp. NBC_00886]